MFKFKNSPDVLSGDRHMSRYFLTSGTLVSFEVQGKYSAASTQVLTQLQPYWRSACRRLLTHVEESIVLHCLCSYSTYRVPQADFKGILVIILAPALHNLLHITSV